ncbi:MAG TPA: RagB/SusD family nutrient uptake outer membrane protein [Longimicrobiaceae bacterium]|nr:RagB/SusD family nutrient uptake outer membrane protein [Longimicrobiaceae bacterium]
MNTRIRTTLAAALAVLVGAAAGCTDITTEPTSQVTGANIFNDPASYRAFLAKLYGGLQVTGQRGPDGSGDIEGIDEGFSHYIRQLWQLEELPTDEALIGWGDAGLPEINTQLWGPSNQFLTAMYYRIFYQVSLANEFLRETTDNKLQSRNASAELVSTVHQYRAEARFLRALSYWHGLDLFGNIPLVTEADELGSTPPKQATRQQVYDYVVSELNAIKADLPAPGAAEYGRADQGASQMLLAKVLMNAGVYTGAAHYAEALTALQSVLGSGAYSLDPNYKHLFAANNNTSDELIFAVPYDGKNTRTWGGMTFLVHAAVGGSMNASNYGIDGGWWGLRVRPQVYALYGSGDVRGDIFYTSGQTVDIGNVSDFTQGVAAPKYTNVTTGGAPGSNVTFPDTDYPMFRLGDAYLMYAELFLRGAGGTQAQALTYVNAIRQRAYGNTSGNITAAQLTLPFLKDERARELLWEGHRRTDLVRFGSFTTAGIWQWKGGVKDGKVTEAFRDLYPIPASELTANPNLKQNAGY